MTSKETINSGIRERIKIGELARRSGVSHRTIHYYEEEGLLTSVERTEGGHRYYDDEAPARLHKIRQLQEIGLSLDNIRSVIDLYFEEPSGIKGKEEVLKILQRQLIETEHKIDELNNFYTDLKKNITRIEQLIKQAQQNSD